MKKLQWRGLFADCMERHCNRWARAVVLTSFVLLTECGAGTIAITFDGPPTQPPGTSYSVTSYGERGTGFAGFFARTGAGSMNRPTNGTAYIQPTGIITTNGAPVTCSRSGTFGLVSVDLAGYSTVVPDYEASFVGHRSNGSAVTTNFAISGLTFQTYYFSSAFTDLTNVLMKAGSLDNLKLQVPTNPPVLTIECQTYYDDVNVFLRIQGTAGLNYRLEYSDRFPATNWVTLSTFESSFYHVEFPEQATNTQQRFFRVVELP